MTTIFLFLIVFVSRLSTTSHAAVQYANSEELKTEVIATASGVGFHKENAVETTTEVWQAQKSELVPQKETFAELTGDASYLSYEPGDCAGKPAGYFGDPRTYCKNYIVCQDDGRLDEFRCPEFTRFNNYLLLCDWHWMVDERCNPLDLSKDDTLGFPPPFDPIIKVLDITDSSSKNGRPRNYAMRKPPSELPPRPPAYAKPERPTEEITIHVIDLGKVEGRNSGEPRRQPRPHKEERREGYDQIYDPNNKSPYLPYAEAKYRPLST